MRIIAGIYRSRILKSLKGMALRPTSDYMRETLFNVLGPAVEGSRFICPLSGPLGFCSGRSPGMPAAAAQ